MVNKGNVQILVDALRSGEYAQCTGSLVLHHEDGSREYCCLGVATVLAIKAGVKVTEDGTNPNSSCSCNSCRRSVKFQDPSGTVTAQVLPPAVKAFYGFDFMDPELLDEDNSRTTATQLNDRKKYSFPRIADAFERTYLHE